MSEKSDVQRRTVLMAGGAIGAAGVIAACGGSGSGGATATSSAAPSTSAAPSSSGAATSSAAGEVLAKAADIPVGGGQVFDGPKVVVTQPASGSIRGFTAVCPHQGCLVNEVVNNEIICPCHDSRFSADDGSVLRGPAVRGLAAAPVSVQGDEVVLA